MERSVQVRYRKPGILGWLALFLKWRQMGFLASLSLLTGGLLAPWFREYPLYMLSGFLGGLCMIRFSDDAQAAIRPADRDMVIARLERSAFSYDPIDGSWTPPLPPFLRWPETKVTLVDRTATMGSLTLVGPRSYLVRLARGLEAPPGSPPHSRR